MTIRIKQLKTAVTALDHPKQKKLNVSINLSKSDRPLEHIDGRVS